MVFAHPLLPPIELRPVKLRVTRVAIGRLLIFFERIKERLGLNFGRVGRGCSNQASSGFAFIIARYLLFFKYSFRYMEKLVFLLRVTKAKCFFGLPS